MMGMGFGLGLLGLLFMVLFWGGLIVGAIWLVNALFPRNVQTSTPPAGRDLSAREILDRRYSRGEITREQYELMRQDIR